MSPTHYKWKLKTLWSEVETDIGYISALTFTWHHSPITSSSYPPFHFPIIFTTRVYYYYLFFLFAVVVYKYFTTHPIGEAAPSTQVDIYPTYNTYRSPLDFSIHLHNAHSYPHLSFCSFFFSLFSFFLHGMWIIHLIREKFHQNREI